MQRQLKFSAKCKAGLSTNFLVHMGVEDELIFPCVDRDSSDHMEAEVIEWHQCDTKGNQDTVS